MISEHVLEQIGNITGSVYTDNTTRQSHGLDWTRFYEPDPSAVAFPRTTQEVSDLVRLANEHDFGLVPSGGRTGLSGGAVANNKELVVSFDKMNKICQIKKLRK